MSLSSHAVLSQLDDSNASMGVYVSNLAGYEVVRQTVKIDLWAGMKTLFCGLANVKARPLGDLTSCKGDGLGSFVRNDRAIEALKRIEGPGSGDCSKNYKWGVPLAFLGLGVPLIAESVAAAVTDSAVESYANTTFWSKLVENFCPLFNMAIVPMVDSAILIADTPSYNVDYWKTLGPDDCDSFDETSAEERPLRAVAVAGNYGSIAGAASGPVNDPRLIGGCYVAGSVEETDGVVLVVAPPKWLESLHKSGDSPPYNTGLQSNAATPTSYTSRKGVDPDDPAYNGFVNQANKMYVQYAHAVYVANMLRGRVGSTAGRLRFDIAPGSCVKLPQSRERFIDNNDDLVEDRYANVSRVTISINCESGQAGTSFQMTHIRSETENKSFRSSVNRHPLFGEAIHGDGKHGAPLIDALNDLEE